MSVIGQVVIHKKLGKGIICNFKSDSKEKYIMVSFLDYDKDIKFLFPGSFENFLRAEDMEFQREVDKLLTEKINENIIREKEKVLQREREDRYFSNDNINEMTTGKSSKSSSSRKSKSNTKPKKNSSNKGANLVFKLNYCDGGKTEESIGFNGICSDKVIENNIIKEKRTWCTQPECDCFRYYNGEINRKELDSIAQDGSACYEGQLLKEWTCYAGVSHSKDNKWKPKTIKRAQKNKLCFLSTREPDSKEDDRFIFGVFLIDEVFIGDDSITENGNTVINEGFVKSNSSYRIKLSKEESKKVLFWDYHTNDNGKKVWNSGLFRYIEDDEALNILEKIVDLKKNTNDESEANNLLEYFKKVNKI